MALQTSCTLLLICTSIRRQGTSGLASSYQKGVNQGRYGPCDNDHITNQHMQFSSHFMILVQHGGQATRVRHDILLESACGTVKHASCGAQYAGYAADSSDSLTVGMTLAHGLSLVMIVQSA